MIEVLTEALPTGRLPHGYYGFYHITTAVQAYAMSTLAFYRNIVELDAKAILSSSFTFMNLLVIVLKR